MSKKLLNSNIFLNARKKTVSKNVRNVMPKTSDAKSLKVMHGMFTNLLNSCFWYK